MFPIPWNFPFRKRDGSLGKIEDLSGSYTLPTASAETKGGVKIGSGLTMTGEVLSADAQLPAYTSAEAGKVLVVNEQGQLAWATVSGGRNFGAVTVKFDPPVFRAEAKEGTV